MSVDLHGTREAYEARGADSVGSINLTGSKNRLISQPAQNALVLQLQVTGLAIFHTETRLQSSWRKSQVNNTPWGVFDAVTLALHLALQCIVGSSSSRSTQCHGWEVCLPASYVGTTTRMMKRQTIPRRVRQLASLKLHLRGAHHTHDSGRCAPPDTHRLQNSSSHTPHSRRSDSAKVVLSHFLSVKTELLLVLAFLHCAQLRYLIFSCDVQQVKSMHDNNCMQCLVSLRTSEAR